MNDKTIDDTNAQAGPSDDPKSHPTSNAEKDPSDWVTGDEKMTGAQASYLKTLSEEAKEEFDPSLTKADASLKIEELQAKTGRGQKS
ncbi:MULTISPECIES: DUF3072 domain-containing protein [unclassified Caballeronia]|jgi:hypothetical protein|uniref:DUF3072 domain-containing protein n=1 Tax=unclassified Caballeronia TaxID=2646786 RepID=UPI001FD04990|nr:MULTISPECIES: DUF3072 domain-containing protein [unclassified Caballeronia]MDR5773358.1 DUF3072 domain-containing protein [Caballeronia sp. LZ002]MDR5806133.1 DUF3072 domain-containing protein [Caballeronia sp. LZ001]MDR5848792.1 DUF3072 domain-containing protein [Caballeronia sp. LZ003]